MKNKTLSKKENQGKVRILEDFLPSPDELIFKTDQVKVTLSLSKSSIQFFKKEAKKRHTPYQKMIRNLLDFYANRFRRCS